MNKTKIGIPRALLYYKYSTLYLTFFKELGLDVVVSPITNKEILEKGKKYAMDEACLSLKIYMGHVWYLTDKVDYIFVPRIVSLEKGMKLCTYFSALYDIVKNTFDVKVLGLNIDVDKNITEEDAFIKLGEELGYSKNNTLDAYKKAKREEYKQNKIKYLIQNKKLESNKTKVLLVSHPYNLNDNLVGEVIKEILKRLDVEIIESDTYNACENSENYKNISPKLYFTYNQELLNAIEEYKSKVDGIILLSTFPCGPDSLVNEMCIRKLNDKIITIMMDELSSKEGLETRIESFIDILKKEDIYE